MDSEPVSEAREVAQLAAELSAIQKRTVETAERLMDRLSTPPPPFLAR